MEGNVVWNNGWAGLMHEISFNAVIRNNTVTNNGACNISGVVCDNRGAFWRVEVLIFNAGLQSIQSEITGNTLEGPNLHLLFLEHDRDNFHNWNWFVHDNVGVAGEWDFDCDTPDVSVATCNSVEDSIRVEN